MNDLVIGTSVITEMGGGGGGRIKNLRKGVEWSRTHSAEEEMKL